MSDQQSAAAAAFARLRAAMAITSTTAAEKTVLLVLTIMANQDGQAWPPIRGATGLASRCSLGERTVARALRGLEAAGLVKTDEVPGKGSIYTVDPCQSGSPTPPLPERQGSPLPERQATPARAATKQPRTTIGKKTTSSPHRARNAIEALPALPGGVTDQQWADFVEMRQRMARGPKGRPWTAGAARKAIDKLHALATAGHDPGAVLDASVLNGWQGLFPPKDDQHGKRTDHMGGSGGARGDRGRPVDGFTAALREVAARGNTIDAGRG